MNTCLSETKFLPENFPVLWDIYEDCYILLFENITK